MKRKSLTTAVLAGLTGVAGMISVASAVNVNPDGLGQVLIYPYYTARGGNDTLISVVNTSSAAKAAKVRFLEGLNSREVLDFNLYLSPFDVWTAAVTSDEGGGAKLVTGDTSCTVPYIFGAGGEQPFLNFAYSGEEADGGPEGLARTQSGYIEIIDMGTLVDSSRGPVDVDGDDEFDPYASADGFADASGNVVSNLGAWWYSEHVDKEDEDGNFIERSPRDCGVLSSYWTNSTSGPLPFLGVGNWLANPLADFEETTTGGQLFGAASIINVNEGTMFSYNATAIDNWTTAVAHTNPGNLQPRVADGSNTVAAVFRSSGQDVDVRDWGSNLDAVNAVLMQDTVLNEYAINPGLAGLTEWVFTFPTKRFHVDTGLSLPEIPPRDVNDCDGDGDVNEVRPDCDDADNDGNVTEPTPNPDTTPVLVEAPRAPFGTLFDGEACEPVSFTFYNREELTPTGSFGIIPPIVSPAPPTPDVDPETFDLCYETNVVRFASAEAEVPDASEILGEPRFITLPLADRFPAGWAEFDMDPGPATYDAADFLDREIQQARELSTDLTFGNGPGTYYGLPVVGFAVNTFSNGTLSVDGSAVLSNYGGTFQHRGTRRIENGAPEDDLSTGN